jgi:hypothetical protein
VRAAQTAVVYEIERHNPSLLDVRCRAWEIERDVCVLTRFAAEQRIRSREMLECIWDRDVFILYGDPALDARVVRAQVPAYEVERSDGLVRIRVNHENGGGRPAVVFLERAGRRLETAPEGTRLLDDTLIVPLAGTPAGGEVEVRWR